MTLTTALVALAIALLGLIGTVYRAGNTVDLWAPFRDRSLARAARKLARNETSPETLERTYWRARDYVRDSARLQALGYSVTTESVTGPFIVHHVPGRGGGRTIRRRVPVCHVTYERQPCKPCPAGDSRTCSPA